MNKQLTKREKEFAIFYKIHLATLIVSCFLCIVFAWPTAEIAVMGPEGAANIVFRREIEDSVDPEAMRAEKIAEYREKFANPYVAASKGYVDEVIEPTETRDRLIHALQVSRDKQVYWPEKKHGVPPF